jgi:hypothetical protein
LEDAASSERKNGIFKNYQNLENQQQLAAWTEKLNI